MVMSFKLSIAMFQNEKSLGRSYTKPPFTGIRRVWRVGTSACAKARNLTETEGISATVAECGMVVVSGGAAFSATAEL